MGAGYWGVDDPRVTIGIYPNLAANNDAANRRSIPDGGDFISLGGLASNEAVRIVNATSKTANANRVEITGAGAGFSPGVRALGADTNISFGIDAKRTGGVRINQDHGRPVLHVNGVSGANAFLDLVAGSGGFASVVAQPTNGATTADLLLSSTGAGLRVRFGTFSATVVTPNGHIEIKTAAGDIFRISGQKV
ncbi:hypothetical protein JIX58_00765 [Brevundimonas diminuta]|uniref:hypothetical protein n=1 Tax=Brevundimonas TaxID=41275 RepID=UPI0019080966|nr:MULTISPECIES: hypothetical protein [Brevundimonas]MBK1974274.1 hypothetical protein [Brevundimonas diminuta]MDA0742802.1 hypothetical protein [Pseudomonadota bacterium]MDA1322547.1 hypothetical protein [Pseudomonadota bacterium]